jgi:SAM-dependent methyltransferase
MLCLEPNPDFCAIARRNCAKYSKVEIQTTSFEEWNLEAKRFNAVLAATSIHWIPPEVAYPKVANTLQDDGSLILLWNVPAIPSYEVYQALQEVYQVHAPSLCCSEKLTMLTALLPPPNNPVAHRPYKVGWWSPKSY